MYLENRQKLISQLPTNSVAIVTSSEELIRNRDVEYPFRVDSNFHYLTGFNEPDCVLFIINTEQPKTVMFLREKDPEKETWEGRRLGVEAAPQVLQVDESYSIEELDEVAPELIKGCDSICFSFEELDEIGQAVNQWIKVLKGQVRQGINAPTQLHDLDSPLHELRLFKSSSELTELKRACEISVQGHLAAMQAVMSSDFEYQVQAELEAKFKTLGSPRVAFNSIVASGENACILHYTENDSEIDKKALLLVDAGAEFNGYAGDITTTFPASGKFTAEQAALYSLVLKAQRAVIDMVAPGESYNQMHDVSVQVLTEGLVELGLLNGEVEKLIEDQAFKRFYMHGTGHWLGRDVHDVGLYKIAGEWRELQPGMVLTVEPGLYISSEHADVDEKWHNIGIRIEDDVLVTEQGCEVLTQGLPRTVEEIEAWMQTNA